MLDHGTEFGNPKDKSLVTLPRKQYGSHRTNWNGALLPYQPLPMMQCN